MNANRFYVYSLIDPRDETVFYIGKGTGNRWKHHQWASRTGNHHNAAVAERIEAIRAHGLQVQGKLIWENLSEADAYARERRLITMIGVNRLTNLIPGGGGLTNPCTWEERQMQGAASILRRYPNVPDFLRVELEHMVAGRHLWPREIVQGLEGQRERVEALWNGTWRNDSLKATHA